MLEPIACRADSENTAPARRETVARRGGADEVEWLLRTLMPDRSRKYPHLVGKGTAEVERRSDCLDAVPYPQRSLSDEALVKARSELAHVARVMSLGVLTASIAHELCQPLSGIITNANTCVRMLTAANPNVAGARENARRTLRDGNRAVEIVTRLRALFTRRETKAEPVDLNDAIRDVVALSSSELKRNQVVLRLDLAADLPLVTGDRVQLQQVILNLLLNASDAMNGVHDQPRRLLVRTARDAADQVCVSVQDAGIGLDADALDRLFEPFHTTKSEGMGIGLFVSRSIVESHRGRLWAARNDGRGATFSFCIPCKTPDMQG